MSYRIRRLGWLPDPLDHRDQDTRRGSVRARLNQVVPVLSRGVMRPASSARNGGVGELQVDLREWCSPIEDQGQIGSCTAHAVVSALEYFERKTRGQHVDASRRFLYRVTRRYLGWEGKGDTGAFLRSAIKALRLFGALPEEYWPYDEENYDAEPEAFHYAFAQNFKALEYFRVPENKDDLQQVLLAGLPFVFGFTCFDSLDHRDVGKTGVIPYPRRADKVTGGHAVLAVGFTHSHILIRNSWGEHWGQDGYGYLPWTYFDAQKPLADDCWVLVNAAWMPDDEGEQLPRAFQRGGALKVGDRVAAEPVCAPSHAVTRADEKLVPQVRVSTGVDPIRALPLRFTPAAAGAALRADAEAATSLARSSVAVSLYLTQLELLKSFDLALFGGAINELYLVAITWDLSGEPPRVFPPAQLKQDALRIYALEKGETIRFVGDGLQLWPSQPVIGGLYVRLIIMESDSDLRSIGTQLEAVREAIKGSELAAALAPLLGGAGVSAPVLASVGVGADLLMAVVARALQENDDDLVALFDGTYGAERITGSRRERYTQAGAAIELDFVAQAPEGRGATRVGPREPAPARARGRKSPRDKR